MTQELAAAPSYIVASVEKLPSEMGRVIGGPNLVFLDKYEEVQDKAPALKGRVAVYELNHYLLENGDIQYINKEF